MSILTSRTTTSCICVSARFGAAGFRYRSPTSSSSSMMPWPGSLLVEIESSSMSVGVGSWGQTSKSHTRAAGRQSRDQVEHCYPYRGFRKDDFSSTREYSKPRRFGQSPGDELGTFYFSRSYDIADHVWGVWLNLWIAGYTRPPSRQSSFDPLKIFSPNTTPHFHRKNRVPIPQLHPSQSLAPREALSKIDG